MFVLTVCRLEYLLFKQTRENSVHVTDIHQLVFHMHTRTHIPILLQARLTNSLVFMYMFCNDVHVFWHVHVACMYMYVCMQQAHN
jgi:hypothetical protein